MTENQGVQRARQGGESAAAVYHTPTRMWVCVALIIIGFTIGAAAIPLHSTIMLIIGCVAFVGFCGLALALGLMQNVH